MAVINQVVRHVSLAFARSAVEIVARQEDSTTPLTGTVSSSTTPTTVASSPPLSGSPSPLSTDSPGEDGTDNGGTNSPLLFFVALGFGVVFTNLWIIVGVKYCFRYNARARAMRANANGEPITMENMARPRRRREKKLMTIEEVNEKFPMMKYKSWVSARALQGLPTAGGVSAPPSRANSVRSVGATTPDLISKDRTSTDEQASSKSPQSTKPDLPSSGDHQQDEQQQQKPEPATDTASTQEKKEPQPHDELGQSSNATGQPETPNAQDTTQRTATDDDDDDDDDEEHITAAMPQEWYGTSGDTCAICIDTLEDDDDVRGLTCGHAFHAVCVDPWLLSRRACCPLCKRDYYTPKPGAPSQPHSASPTTPNTTERRRTSLLFRARHSRSNPTSSNTQISTQPGTQNSEGGFVSRLRSVFLPPRQPPTSPPPPPIEVHITEPPQARTSRFRPPTFRFLRRDRHGESPANMTTPTEPTPSQLESGAR